MKTWILLANAARARLFEASPGGEAVSELKGLIAPESRQPDRMFDRGRPGRVRESASSARHAIEPRLRPRDKHAWAFAQELADLLAQGLAQREYGRLLLVAPPRFLGRLRTCLEPQVTQRVVLEQRRDCVDSDLGEIQALVRMAGVPGRSEGPSRSQHV